MSDDLKDPGSPIEGDAIEWYDRAYPDDHVAAATTTDTVDLTPDVTGDDTGDAADDATDLADDPIAAASAPWYRRAGRRVVRRPVGWWRRPWTNERVVRVLVTS